MKLNLESIVIPKSLNSLTHLISINQIDLCHTSNISSKGWFIHLFEKKVKKLKEKKKDIYFKYKKRKTEII